MMEAVSVAKNVQEEADFWKTWSKYDRPMEHAVTWADVNAKIALKEVAPFTDGYWEMYDAALMLMAPSSARSSLEFD